MATDTMSAADAVGTLRFITEVMPPVTRSKRAAQPVTEAMAVEAAHDLNAATNLINLSRNGTNLAEMTPNEAIDAIQARTHEDDHDRFVQILKSVHAETLKREFGRIASKVPQMPSASKAAKVTRQPKTAYNNDPVNQAALWRKHVGIPEVPIEKAADVVQTPDNANNGDLVEEAPNTEQIPENANKSDPAEDQSAQTPEAANTDEPSKEAAEAANAPEDAKNSGPVETSSKRKKTKHERSKNKGFNRGHIEMFTKAIGRIINTSGESIPDYASPFNAPDEEEEIINCFFIEEYGETDGVRFKKNPMGKEAAHNKWKQAKKQLFMCISLWYELNCRVEAARNANDTSMHPFNWPTSTPSSVASTPGTSDDNTPSSSSSTTSTSPTASPGEPSKSRITFGLWDINATRCQAGAGLNVALVRPIMRTLRPKDDRTFVAKASRNGQITKHPREDDLAGLLADKKWVPQMVQKTAKVDENGNKLSEETVINHDWYDILGTTQERTYWLQKVLDKKAVLEAESRQKGQDKNGNPIKEEQEAQDVKVEGKGKKRKLEEDDVDEHDEDDGAAASSSNANGKKRKIAETPTPTMGSRRSSRATKKTLKATAAAAGDEMEIEE